MTTWTILAALAIAFTGTVFGYTLRALWEFDHPRAGRVVILLAVLLPSLGWLMEFRRGSDVYALADRCVSVIAPQYQRYRAAVQQALGLREGGEVRTEQAP